MVPIEFLRPTGLVVEDSVIRKPGELEIEFTVTDLEAELAILYNGLLPDLFREGQGIIAHGRLIDGGRFVADTVLAKHDENYMPPEVADSLVAGACGRRSRCRSRNSHRKMIPEIGHDQISTK